MRICLLFLCFSSALAATAQVTVDGQVTGRHADAIEQAKGARHTAEQREAQARQLQEQARAQQLYKQKYDSIRQARLKLQSSDSIATDSLFTFSRTDSLQMAEQVLNETNFPPEYRELIINPISLEEELSSEEADSIALARATAILDAEARKFMPNELGETRDPLSELTDPMNQNPVGDAMPGIKAPTKPNPNLVKPDAARALFKKVDPEQFKDAQANMQKMKKKYNELPDTRYPEEGTKRNSLADVPFKKRLYFGGNISLQSTDPLILSSNLQLGYWINKKWLGGVGVTLREQFSAEDSTATVTGDGHGYSLFTRYDIPKGFFAWGESEWQIDRSLFSAEERASSGWQKAYMLGIGREFKIGFVRMQSIIMYDFNYQNNTLNTRPWVFRIGVQISKKPG